MPRTVKTLKDKDGNDIEVYADTCIQCTKEMMFPKLQADYLEQSFPFLREKLDAGTVCTRCASENFNNNKENLFSQEELELIKAKLSSDE